MMQPFAAHGSQKMIYDIRMGPQGILHDSRYVVGFQGNAAGTGHALPQVVMRQEDGTWTDPVVLGEVSCYDHHFAPVLWLDADRRIHALFHCHIYLDESRHLVSARPMDCTAWEEAPAVAPSTSYPRILHMADDKLLLYHRPLGHMGYWTYQVSGDGGFSWYRQDDAVVDFDQRPLVPGDDWAGSYHSVVPSNDRKSLHVAFVYWDERNWPHPVFKKQLGHRNRYNLYYLRIDVASGLVYNAAGERLPRPLIKRDADEKCMVLNSGHALTNMPTILPDTDDNPRFMLPVSGASLDKAAFHWVAWNGTDWDMAHVADMNSTWNGSHLEHAPDGGVTAYLVAAPGTLGNLPYGGGRLQEWHSADNGATWSARGDITGTDGFVCNNPRPVEDADGNPLPRTLLFFGWPGPDGVMPEGPFTGRAFLWKDGEFL